MQNLGPLNLGFSGKEVAEAAIPLINSISELPSAASFKNRAVRIGTTVLYSDGTFWKATDLVLYSSAAQIVLTGSVDSTVMLEVPIPDEAMGPNSTLRIEPVWSCPNNANNKTMQIYFGTSIGSAALDYNRTRTAIVQEAPLIQLVNRGVRNAQLNQFGALGTYTTAQTGAISARTINFAQSGMKMFLVGQLANAADNLTIEGLVAKIINPYL